MNERAPILSPRNERVKALAKLRDRRERDRSGLSLVDGAREIARALDAGAPIEELLICRERLTGPDAETLPAALARAHVPVTEASADVVDRLAFGDRSEGVVAVLRVPQRTLDDVALPADPLIVVIESVEKPGNLGAILRTADAAGVDAVIAADPVTDLYNPAAIRASLGTIFTLRPVAARSDETLAWLRAHGVRPVVARVDAAQTYTETDLRGPVAIVVGSEAHGLGPAWHGDDVEAVSLPMHGTADSLNVSTATAIVLYETRRQRGRPAR